MLTVDMHLSSLTSVIMQSNSTSRHFWIAYYGFLFSTMICSMQRNWSKNKMTLRTRNCWERLSNIVGLYRYSRASLFLSTNVCFLHFWLDIKNVLFVFTLLPRLPVPRSRAKETFDSVGDIRLRFDWSL